MVGWFFGVYLFFDVLAVGSSRFVGIKSVRYVVEMGRGVDLFGKCGVGGYFINDNIGWCGVGDENAVNFFGYWVLDGELFCFVWLVGERCFFVGWLFD